jgi:hypothetical protein
MSSNIRIMKAISLDLYKRMVESSTSLSNSSASTNRSHDGIYGSGNHSTKDYRTGEVSILNSIPTEFIKSTVDEDPVITNTILKSIPDQQRGRARNLVNAILPHKQLQWDDSGRISYLGKIIPRSNIVDLISVATKSTKLRKLNIPALGEFMSFLRIINVPRHFLGTHFAQLIDEPIDESSSVQHENVSCNHWITFEQAQLSK